MERNMGHYAQKFHRTENNFFSLVSLSQVDYGHLIAFTTGVQASGLNPAIVKKIDNQFNEALDSCDIDYKKNQVPWALVLPDYLLSDDIERRLQLSGFSNAGSGVAMMLELEQLQIPLQSSTLKCKEMQNDLDAWSIPLISGFESTPEITSVYAQRHKIALANSRSIYHFSGYLGNDIVSSLTLSICGNLARIDDVATIPAYQKQGFGSALIYEALNYARQQNISCYFLEASSDGLNLYKRIGFKELFTNQYYEKITG